MWKDEFAFKFKPSEAEADVAFDDKLILAVLEDRGGDLRFSLETGPLTPASDHADPLGGLFAPQSIDIYEG